MPTFDLLSEPWIPVLDAGTDLRAAPGAAVRLRHVGLREALVRAHEIREVATASPLETVALDRLLLALFLDALNPGPDSDRWHRLWSSGRADADALDAYLAGSAEEGGPPVRERFDLLHPERPFYQHPEPLARDATTLSQMLHAEAAGNNATLFGHEMDDPPRPEGEPARRLPLADAARAVLAYQAYGLGGLAGSAKDGKRLDAFRHAPLVSGAVFWLRGRSLFDALLLNAPPEPAVWLGGGDDRPAWRRPLPAPRQRVPEGLRDLLTWQGRRVTLVTEPGPDGTTVATGVYVSNGEMVDADGVPDPMMARVESKDTGVFPFGLRSERAVWRDAEVLHRVTAPDEWGAPETFRQLAALVADDYDGALPGRAGTVWTADVFGVVNDKSKMLRWRHGSAPVYAALLGDDLKLDNLRRALDLADEQAVSGKHNLRFAIRTTAEYLLSPPPPGSDDRPNADPKAVSALAASLDAERRFWVDAEPAFLTFLDGLAQADDEARQRAALLDWCRDLWDAAARAFDDATSALDRSARHLQARARGLYVLRPVEMLREHDDAERRAADSRASDPQPALSL